MPSTTLFEATTVPAAPPTSPSGSRPTQMHAGGVHHFNRVAVLALPIGVVLSVLTTQDPLWWQQHFSQLGTFGDASSRTFNSTVMLSGFFLAVYGVLVAVALPARTGRRARRAFRIAITSAGLHLSLVGVIPIPVSPGMHDLIASGLGLSFLGIVATSLALPGRSRRFRQATAFCVVLLATGMVVLTAGFITLALFELVAFVAMGIWLTALPRALAYAGPSPSTRRLARRRARRIARAGRRVAAQRPPVATTTPRPSAPSTSSLPTGSRRTEVVAPTETAGVGLVRVAASHADRVTCDRSDAVIVRDAERSAREAGPSTRVGLTRSRVRRTAARSRRSMVRSASQGTSSPSGRPVRPASRRAAVSTRARTRPTGRAANMSRARRRVSSRRRSASGSRSGSASARPGS